MIRARDVLFVVSATLPHGPVESPGGPRKDYVALARALDAAVLDRSEIERSPVARLLGRMLGAPAAQAWLASRQHDRYAAILTDGEHVAIPLALLLKLAGASTPHVTIGHRLTAAKKRPFFRWLKVHSHIDRIALHARRQYDLALEELQIPADRLALVPYQVDTDFWRPLPVPEERLICSAGLEFRDYPVLMQAVDGLDVQTVIGAASHWSRRKNSAADAHCPANVEIRSFDYQGLRQLYARAAVVVVPLHEIDFQAGVTTLLEAMAMGKAVVVTATQGQSDVVVDRRTSVRGVAPRPVSLLRALAEERGVRLEPNGFYVPPGDPEALRSALTFLLDHPEERARLGQAGRRTVERLLTVDLFAERMRNLVLEACASRAAAPAPQGGPFELGREPSA